MLVVDIWPANVNILITGKRLHFSLIWDLVCLSIIDLTFFMISCDLLFLDYILIYFSRSLGETPLPPRFSLPPQRGLICTDKINVLSKLTRSINCYPYQLTPSISTSIASYPFQKHFHEDSFLSFPKTNHVLSKKKFLSFSERGQFPRITMTSPPAPGECVREEFVH